MNYDAGVVDQFSVLSCLFSESAPRAETGMGLEVIASLREVSRRFLSKKPPRRIRVFRFPVGALPTGDALDQLGIYGK